MSFHLHTCILLNVLHSGIPSGHQQWSGGLPVSLPSAHSCSRRSSAQLASWLKVSFGNQIPISAAVPWPYTLFLHSGPQKLFCYIPASTLTQADTSVILCDYLCKHFFCFKAWHPTFTLISISEHVDKGGLPPPSGQTLCQVPSKTNFGCIMYKDWSSSISGEQILPSKHFSLQKLQYKHSLLERAQQVVKYQAHKRSQRYRDSQEKSALQKPNCIGN